MKVYFLIGLCFWGCNGYASALTEYIQLREERISQKLATLRTQPTALHQFLQAMPKGADLHNHLSGAIETARLIQWGIEDGACINLVTLIASLPPCIYPIESLSQVMSDPKRYQQVLEAWSMENFQGNILAAHQHFFESFVKFSAIYSETRLGDAIAEALFIAGKNQQIYIELMQGFGMAQIGMLASRYFQADEPWTESTLLKKRTQLIADPTFQTVLEKNRTLLPQAVQRARQLLGCDQRPNNLGCEVDVRFLASANRTKDRASVFAQWVYGYELVQVSPWILGVELVSPEEHVNSLRYYDDEMFALGVLHRMNQSIPERHPVRISLHAGELIPEVLPKTMEGQAHLYYHIRHAVEMAHAERIGHGVTILENSGSEKLMQLLRDKQVMVEICLTSNATLLGKQGDAHPLQTYLVQQVPVALATDDQGILKTDITKEFMRAVTLHHLEYSQLKKMIRASITYSFLTGKNLWDAEGLCTTEDLENLSPSINCQQFLKNSQRAQMQWKLEMALKRFEESLL